MGNYAIQTYKSQPIELVLSRLEKVRLRRTSQWSACCPAHQDKNPSLSVRETDEGAVLIHCFSGCDVHSIVDSLGINISDLFPSNLSKGGKATKLPKLIDAPQALELLNVEATLIAIVGLDLSKGKVIKKEDLNRCSKAVARISWIHTQYMEHSK